MKITYNEYDAIVEKVSKIPNNNTGVYPDPKDIQQFAAADFEKYMYFLIWLSETAGTPKTEKDRAGRQAVQDILLHHLNFIDDYEENETEAPETENDVMTEQVPESFVFEANEYGQFIMDWRLKIDSNIS